MSSLRTSILLASIASAFPVSHAFAEDSIKDPTYNMPDAVVATMGVDEVMKKMETPVAPEVLSEFKKKHPAPFWLFGEDRQLAVRNNIIPAHWFEGGAKQYGKFSGVARPGEFYVFQVAVVGGEKGVSLNADTRIPTLVGAVSRVINRDGVYVAPGETKTIWIGVQIPADAKAGEYHGNVALSNTPVISGYTGSTTVSAGVLKIGGGDSGQQVVPSGGGTLVLSGNGAYAGSKTLTDERSDRLTFTLKVEGEPIKESGTDDAWRLARLKWLDSKIGESNTEVTRPFTAVKVNAQARTLDILGRRITLGENGIPSQFTSYFSASNTKVLDTGRDAFAGAPKLEIMAGKPVTLVPKEFKFTRQTPVGVEWVAISEGDAGLRLVVTGHLEFDGNLRLKMRLENPRTGNEYGSVKLDDVRFIVPWAKDTAKYAMGLGLQGGATPAQHRWKWNVSKNQDSIWMGDTNIGAMLRFKGANYHRPLINAYYAFSPLALPDSWGSGGINLENKEGQTTLIAYSGPVEVLKEGTSKSPCAKEFDLDWHFTPFKPLDLKKHFTDRIYHRTQGQGIEKPAELKKDGANIIEVHHNRVTNPYINYPFNDDSFGALKDFIKESHAADMRVNLYYTTRELTQNLPEFFALKSLGGEVILPRKEGVKWPVTNGNGPHPWLKAHVGEDIVPAWRENLKFPQYKNALDLAVITTPDSRWNNFYLEGLDYLVKKAGIDGLYIDDTALDRKSMQRARRILDADGNTGRRVNMHSWNHFNGLAAWTNSSIAFMELYPYYDGLWHGESFNANASPEFMLVEMSGIPYGLMSEMLDHPNAWHGMVFGMRTRWPWSGDPRAQWKFESEFGIADAEFIGWFDPACPVKTGNDKIKASVFKKSGKTLIALGSWDKDTKVKLTVDWRALGLDPAKVKLTAPEIKKFQDAVTFAPTDEIPVAGGKGLMLIAE
jgi:hypothetical protein